MHEELWQDVRHAARALKQTPAFTFTAVLTLALAIGANASIFSLLNALTLRRLPVTNPEQLVQVATVFRTGLEGRLSFPMFRELARRQHIFSNVIGWFGDPVLSVDANGGHGPAVVIGTIGNFYSELGVVPEAGRLLVAADVNLDTFTGAPVAVLGYRFWQRRFGGDVAAIGRVVRVEGVPLTIIGVAPRGFKGFGLVAEPDVTVPLTAYPAIFRSAELKYASAGNVLWMKVAARLRPGATLEQARAQLEAVWPAIKSDVIPPTHAGAQRANFLAIRLRVQSLATGEEAFLRPKFTKPLHFLLAIAFIVLLIACVNLASFMLPRVAGRTHEFAVRRALGASRRQAVQHVVIGGLLLSMAGALCGLGLAYWTSAAISDAILSSAPVPVDLDTAPDLRVIGFTATIALLAGLLSALVPAWVMTRRDPRGVLQQYRERISNPGRFGRFLIAGQVALSVILLTNAGLIVRSLQQLLAVDPGFAVDDVLRANFVMRPESDKRPDPESYYPALLECVKVLPGVRQASIAQGPVAQGAFAQLVSRMSSQPTDGIPAAFNSVSPGFFDSLDIPVIRGRDFAWSDHARGPRVAVLGRALASRLFPDMDPIGQRVRIGTQPYRQDLEVIGIVADARLYDIKDSLSYSAYVPALQHSEFVSGGFLMIRGRGIDESQLQQAVQSVGPDYIAQFEPLADVMNIAVVEDRVMASLAGSFGMLTLILAAVGIGGLLAYTVEERTKEIAIRLALGAQPTTIVSSVLREGAAITCAGATIGLAAAIASTSTVRALLFGVSPHDPVVLFGVPVLLVAIAACACTVPAYRAATIDPSVGLRTE